MTLLNLTKILVVLGALVATNTAFGYSDPKIPNGKVLGYTLKGCFSYDSEKNYCKKENQKDIQEVVNKAKAIKEPNFDKDKKLVQSFFNGGKGYATKNGKIPMSDTFIVDEKSKTIYLFPYFASFIDRQTSKKAPEVITKKDSNWFCLHQEGALFRESYIDGSVSSYTEASPAFNMLSCVQFKNKDFSTPTNIFGGFDETKEYDMPYL